MDEEVKLHCGFCDLDEGECGRIIAGPTAGAFICSNCIELCTAILIQEGDPIRGRLAELMAENELLHAHVGTLEHRDRNHRTHIWQLQQALTPFARQMLSSDPDFHRTRPFSLEQHDRQILEARMAMRRRPGDDPLDELARINEELGLYD